MTGPNATNRGKSSSKQHLLTDTEGTPLTCDMTTASLADGLVLLPLLNISPAVAGRPGRPRTRPLLVTADKAYHSAARVEAPARPRCLPAFATTRQAHNGHFA